MCSGNISSKLNLGWDKLGKMGGGLSLLIPDGSFCNFVEMFSGASNVDYVKYASPSASFLVNKISDTIG